MLVWAPRSHDDVVGGAGACASAAVVHESVSAARARAVFMSGLYHQPRAMNHAEIRSLPAGLAGTRTAQRPHARESPLSGAGRSISSTPTRGQQSRTQAE